LGRDFLGTQRHANPREAPGRWLSVLWEELSGADGARQRGNRRRPLRWQPKAERSSYLPRVPPPLAGHRSRTGGQSPVTHKHRTQAPLGLGARLFRDPATRKLAGTPGHCLRGTGDGQRDVIYAKAYGVGTHQGPWMPFCTSFLHPSQAPSEGGTGRMPRYLVQRWRTGPPLQANRGGSGVPWVRGETFQGPSDRKPSGNAWPCACMDGVAVGIPSTCCFRTAYSVFDVARMPVPPEGRGRPETDDPSLLIETCNARRGPGQPLKTANGTSAPLG
jgi:hypothetical protein